MSTDGTFTDPLPLLCPSCNDITSIAFSKELVKELYQSFVVEGNGELNVSSAVFVEEKRVYFITREQRESLGGEVDYYLDGDKLGRNT